jgi:hypothetical protein
MAKKRVLPTIDAVHDADGVAFYCDGEPIEDMEFSWEDLEDPELLVEVAEELVEYIDGDEIEDIENPVAHVVREIKKLRRTRTGEKAPPSDEEEDFEPEPVDDDDDDDFDD